MSTLRIAALSLGALLVIGHFIARPQVAEMKAQAALGPDGSTEAIQMAENYGRVNNIALLGGIALIIYAGLGINATKRR